VHTTFGGVVVSQEKRHFKLSNPCLYIGSEYGAVVAGELASLIIEMAFPIKKIFNTELFIDRTADHL